MGRFAAKAVKVFGIFLLALILAPLSLSHIVSAVGIDPHPISFIIGPALYGYADTQNIPNLDFDSQYGTILGPFFFKAFLTSSLQTTLEHYYAFVLGGTFFYFLTFAIWAKRLLKSDLIVIALTVFLVIMNFYGPAPFRAGSSWPVRYPFLCVFLLSLEQSIISTTPRRVTLFSTISVALLAASFLWNTETGVYALLTMVAAVMLFGRGALFSRISRALVLFIAFLALVLFSLLLLFGPRVVTLDFVKSIFEPTWLYGSGFGAWPVNWIFISDFLLFLLFFMLPLIAIGMTLPNCLHTLKIGVGGEQRITSVMMTNQDLRCKKEDLQVFLTAMLGVLLLVKWVNMSLSAVMFSNLSLAAIASIYLVKIGGEGSRKRTLICRIAVLLVAFWLLFGFIDPRMQTSYGWKGYRLYPGALNALMRAPTPKEGRNILDASPDPRDVALIQVTVPPGQPVAIFSSIDWAYLISAERPPMARFLPSSMSPLKSQIANLLEKSNSLFIDRSKPFFSIDNMMIEEVDRELKKNFELIRTGVNLELYRKRSNSKN